MDFMKWSVGDVTVTKVPELDRVVDGFLKAGGQ